MAGNIQLPSALGAPILETLTRLDGSDTVHCQGIVQVNPFASVAGAFAASGQTVSCPVMDVPLVAFQVAGTYGSVAAAFEVSIDNTNWHAINAVRADKTALESATGTLSSTVRAWVCDVTGFNYFRLRSTAWTSGSMSVLIQPSNQALDPDPFVVLQAGSALIGGVTVNTKTTGGATLAKAVSAASTNATSLKASAGTLFGCHGTNNGAAFAYVKFYNKASAPTVGTDVPVAIFGLPPNSSIDLGIPESIGGAFATGIAYAITTGMADADTGAVAAAQVALTLSYA